MRSFVPTTLVASAALFSAAQGVTITKPAAGETVDASKGFDIVWEYDSSDPTDWEIELGNPSPGPLLATDVKPVSASSGQTSTYTYNVKPTSLADGSYKVILDPRNAGSPGSSLPESGEFTVGSGGSGTTTTTTTSSTSTSPGTTTTSTSTPPTTTPRLDFLASLTQMTLLTLTLQHSHFHWHRHHLGYWHPQRQCYPPRVRVPHGHQRQCHLVDHHLWHSLDCCAPVDRLPDHCRSSRQLHPYWHCLSHHHWRPDRCCRGCRCWCRLCRPHGSVARFLAVNFNSKLIG